MLDIKTILQYKKKHGYYNLTNFILIEDLTYVVKNIDILDRNDRIPLIYYIKRNEPRHLSKIIKENKIVEKIKTKEKIVYSDDERRLNTSDKTAIKKVIVTKIMIEKIDEIFNKNRKDITSKIFLHLYILIGNSKYIPIGEKIKYLNSNHSPLNLIEIIIFNYYSKHKFNANTPINGFKNIIFFLANNTEYKEFNVFKIEGDEFLEINESTKINELASMMIYYFNNKPNNKINRLYFYIFHQVLKKIK